MWWASLLGGGTGVGDTGACGVGEAGAGEGAISSAYSQSPSYSLELGGAGGRGGVSGSPRREVHISLFNERYMLLLNSKYITVNTTQGKILQNS